ncbi:flagellar hook-basal body complex protein [Ruminococcaceae bacterium OttesenSCG-928-A11]|nr:flagellar hook-basal body complex protein [Ruminococcaceae bacterium OttesenSCG-928-A11]
MVRSMYAGVSGLRSHQTRMDTIGNNIANVNTYGFKSGRTTFRDIYYQSIRSASQPTAAVGGVNPSSVGYGAQVGSVDLMMGRSTFSMTDQTMDIAIDGDGFLQVEDAAGNRYYTRAGMLGFDAAGNLVDMQGNFVLGINGDPTGKGPSSERIQVVLPPVPATPASVTQSVNGLEYTITAEKPTTDGNLNFNFTTDSSLADGEVKAAISSTGIIIQMHPDNTYKTLAEFNDAINQAITEANGGAHPAGKFTVEYTGAAADNPFLAVNMPRPEGYKASELVSVDYSIQLGKVGFTTSNTIFGGVYPTGTVGSTFGEQFTSSPPEVTDFKCTYDDTTNTFNFVMEIDGVSYEGSVDNSKSGSGKFFLRRDGYSETDFVEMARPSFGTIFDAYQDTGDKVAGTYAKQDPPVAGGGTFTITDSASNTATFTVPTAGHTTAASQMNWLVSQINANSTLTYTASLDSAGDLVLTDKLAGTGTPPTVVMGGTTVAATAVNNGLNPVFPPLTGADLTNDGSNPMAVASGPSFALGFSSTSFALRGGTEGGPQTVADMTEIYIATNGVVSGKDAQGIEVIIGRIDLATFANPAGLNQAGTSNYTVSANSGDPQLTQPGMNGSGKLVSGTLELSNVDLSREFSDMITTQRGYQANSRIITVSDTMLEELINLKR